MEIKIIDGVINKAYYTVQQGCNSFVSIVYKGVQIKSRPSTFAKGEQYPIWNQKIFIPVGEINAEKNLKIILTVLGEYKEETIASFTTSIKEFIDWQAGKTEMKT